MDSIHDVAKKPWISSKRLDLSKLLKQNTCLLSENNLTLDGSECDGQRFKDLEGKLEEFIAKDETKVRPYFLFNSTDERVLTTESNCKLKLYEKQLEHAKLMISDRSYKVNYLSRLNTTRRDTLRRHSVLSGRRKNSVTSASNVPSGNDVSLILVVQFWPQPKKNEKLKLETEILFKSDQCLTDLRNQIRCHRDFANPMDLSNDPEQQVDRIFRGELFKSGMFLIGSTFYNDLRDVNNTDLSVPVMKWASEKVVTVDKEYRNHRVSRGIGPFESAPMEKTSFADLKIKLGYPYLYVHQGDCEHLFCISDIRFSQNSEHFQTVKFPFVTAPSYGRKEDTLKCYMCKIGPPHWYTRNNSRLPLDPFFFCENCFKSFNYDKSKKKIGNFSAYLWNWPGQIV